MIKRLFLGITIGLLAFPLLLVAEADGWKVEKNAEGIEVSTRKPEGSPLKAFRGVTTAQGSVDDAVELFEKTDTVCAWVYKCVNFRILEDLSPDEKIIYFHQDMPWPVSDRDVVYRRLRQKDLTTGVVTFTLTDIKDANPELQAGVRLASLNGEWRFTPVQGGKVEIIDEQHVDVGGSLPVWLVNRLVVDVPYSTLKDFRAALQQKGE